MRTSCSWNVSTTLPGIPRHMAFTLDRSFVRFQPTAGRKAELSTVPRQNLPGDVAISRCQERNGSVWESNPLRALFKPSTGFEDQGPHQRCKHSQAAVF